MISDFEHLRGRIDLENVVLPALGIDFASRSGQEIMCHCPDFYGNHKNGDRNPSFTINEDKLVYNCFVCGGGSIVQLVENTFGVPPEAALAWLEEHSNLGASTVEDFTNEIERILARQREELQPLPEYPPELLFQYEGIHSYLLERGISRDVLVEMQVGWDDEHCGIVIPHFFEGRLVGIQTRHLAQSAQGDFLCPAARCQAKSRIPKYDNTPNFPRKETLYNWNGAVEASTGRVIVVESPLSVLYLKTYGIHNVVSTFGAHLSEEQGALLRRFHEGVFFWPDNDAAGLANFEPNLDRKGREYPSRVQIILEDFVPVFIIPTPPGEKADPGDVSPDEIPLYISAAYPSVLYPMEGLRVGIHQIYRGREDRSVGAKEAGEADRSTP